MWGGGVQCIHVDSVQAVDQNQSYYDFVEVGWHTEQLGIDSPCNGITPVNHPVVMYAWRAYGAYHCYEDSTISLSAGTYYPVSVRVITGTTNWQIIFNGHLEPNSPATDFNLGAGVTNAERHCVACAPGTDNTVESANAHFNALKYWEPGPSTWHDWGSIRCYFGAKSTTHAYEDPAYGNTFNSLTDVRVSVGAGCPV